MYVWKILGLFCCSCEKGLYVWMTDRYFWSRADCTGHLVGRNLSRFDSDCNHSQTGWRGFAINHHLIYKCRQIANTLQSVIVSLH